MNELTLHFDKDNEFRTILLCSICSILFHILILLLLGKYFDLKQIIKTIKEEELRFQLVEDVIETDRITVNDNQVIRQFNFAPVMTTDNLERKDHSAEITRKNVLNFDKQVETKKVFSDLNKPLTEDRLKIEKDFQEPQKIRFEKDNPVIKNKKFDLEETSKDVLSSTKKETMKPESSIVPKEITNYPVKQAEENIKKVNTDFKFNKSLKVDKKSIEKNFIFQNKHLADDNIKTDIDKVEIQKQDTRRNAENIPVLNKKLLSAAEDRSVLNSIDSKKKTVSSKIEKKVTYSIKGSVDINRKKVTTAALKPEDILDADRTAGKINVFNESNKKSTHEKIETSLERVSSQIKKRELKTAELPGKKFDISPANDKNRVLESVENKSSVNEPENIKKNLSVEELVQNDNTGKKEYNLKFAKDDTIKTPEAVKNISAFTTDKSIDLNETIKTEKIKSSSVNRKINENIVSPDKKIIDFNEKESGKVLTSVKSSEKKSDEPELDNKNLSYKVKNVNVKRKSAISKTNISSEDILNNERIEAGVSAFNADKKLTPSEKINAKIEKTAVKGKSSRKDNTTEISSDKALDIYGKDNNSKESITSVTIEKRSSDEARIQQKQVDYNIKKVVDNGKKEFRTGNLSNEDILKQRNISTEVTAFESDKNITVNDDLTVNIKKHEITEKIQRKNKDISAKTSSKAVDIYKDNNSDKVYKSVADKKTTEAEPEMGNKLIAFNANMTRVQDNSQKKIYTENLSNEEILNQQKIISEGTAFDSERNITAEVNINPGIEREDIASGKETRNVKDIKAKTHKINISDNETPGKAIESYTEENKKNENIKIKSAAVDMSAYQGKDEEMLKRQARLKSEQLDSKTALKTKPEFTSDVRVSFAETNKNAIPTGGERTDIDKPLVKSGRKKISDKTINLKDQEKFADKYEIEDSKKYEKIEKTVTRRDAAGNADIYLKVKGTTDVVLSKDYKYDFQKQSSEIIVQKIGEKFSALSKTAFSSNTENNFDAIVQISFTDEGHPEKIKCKYISNKKIKNYIVDFFKNLKIKIPVDFQTLTEIEIKFSKDDIKPALMFAWEGGFRYIPAESETAKVTETKKEKTE